MGIESGRSGCYGMFCRDARRSESDKVIDRGDRIRRSLRQTDAKTQDGNVKQSGGRGTAVSA